MNGNKIQDELIQRFLELAEWAPTHGMTEPWQFLVFSGDKVKSFCADHAEMYKQHTAGEKFTLAKYEKLMHNGDKVSHIIVAVMKRGENPKIPALEEIAAVAASVQIILLAATAHGVASFWNTGGMAHHDAMKEYLQLGEQDLVIGIIYLGYSDLAFTDGKRMKTTAEKIKWM